MTQTSTTRTIRAATVLILVACMSTGVLTASAHRAPQVIDVGWKVRQPARFVVSGVLRKDGTVDVIKPVHAIEDADTAEAAEQLFSQGVQRQFKGYTLISTTVSPIPKVGVCEIST